MNTDEIPRPEWSAFLESFLERHREGLVNVRLESLVAGDSEDARERTLAHIELDEDAEHARLAIRTRDHLGRRADHSVPDVTRLRLLRDEGGAEAALFAESADVRLLVHFVVAIPGAVDGIDAATESPASDA